MPNRLEIKVTDMPNEDVIGYSATMTESVSYVSNAVVASAMASVLLTSFNSCGGSLFAQLSGGVLTRFIQTIDMLSRLYLINVNYGILLGDIMLSMSNMTSDLQFPKEWFYVSSKDYFMVTRGKLTAYEINISLLSEMPIFIIFYLLFHF